jgi:hypothetical protein
MKVTIGKYPTKLNKERKISVHIDPWDTWSMDHTLALIIHPMLVQLDDSKHGSPWVDDEDVPEELRSTSAPAKENDYDTDANHFKRWDWVLKEMIWAFSQVLDENAENQFHSGEHDIKWVQVNPEETDEDKMAFEMKRGPNDTHAFDREGWEKWNERKRNGFKLFGKYYEALWD